MSARYTIERVRAAFAALLAITAASFSARALCLAPRGEPDCLPRHSLSKPFMDAVEHSDVCYDTGSPYDEEGRLLYPAKFLPLATFARKHGDAAIPFYRAVIARCEKQTWSRDAFSALAHLRTPRAVSILKEYVRPGQHSRAAALAALLAASEDFAQAPSVAERLREEPERRLRVILAKWLMNHGDQRALPALREALQRETDPDAATTERIAIALTEAPQRCVLDSSDWRLDWLGRQCNYTCRGFDVPTGTYLWRGPFPCPATVSKGRHFTVNVAPKWTALELFTIGLLMLIYPGLIQGVIRRRAILWRRPATRAEGLWFGLVWCAASLVPLGAAVYIWMSQGISLGIRLTDLLA